MEQIRIAIVEDETPHAQLLEQHIVSWGRDRNVGDIPIRRFDNAAAFLFDWAEERYDMIFLDIQMPGINGMETARKIRETDIGVKLVFTTGITDYLQEGYEVEAVRYLLKPINREKVWECLDKLLQEPAPTVQLLFQTQEGVVKVSEQDIEYFEARGHYTICHLTADRKYSGRFAAAESGRKMAVQERNMAVQGRDMTVPERDRDTAVQGRKMTVQGRDLAIQGLNMEGQDQEIQLRESFNALCGRLSQRPFIRCHRSYLCHIRRIHRVERTEIILEGGGRIPVSRRLYEPVVKAFIAYFRKEES